jgi:hypothetical protein
MIEAAAAVVNVLARRGGDKREGECKSYNDREEVSTTHRGSLWGAQATHRQEEPSCAVGRAEPCPALAAQLTTESPESYGVRRGEAVPGGGEAGAQSPSSRAVA